METNEKTTVTIQTIVDSPVNMVWKYWTSPEDIVKWNTASDDWHTPKAENNLRIGGTFKSRMESKDGSMGFDFEGVYTNVILYKKIEYKIGDGRKVKIDFTAKEKQTEIVESFEAESENPVDMQRTGWQAILDNFKKYVEEKHK